MTTRDLGGLTITDLIEVPIWELTGREKVAKPNEGSVLPRLDLDDPSKERMRRFAVRAKFRLNDDAEMLGYVIPSVRGDEPEDYFLGYLAPAIVADAGQVPFWSFAEEEPNRSDVKPLYRRLGRSAEETFPVTFESDVPVSAPDYVSSGLLEGFHYVMHEGGDFRIAVVK